MWGGTLLKCCVSEICVKRIGVNQGVGVYDFIQILIISKCQVSLNERNLRDSICNSEVEFSLLNTPLHSGLSFKNESYIKFGYSDNAT